MSITKKYGYIWVTLFLFGGSFIGQVLTHTGTGEDFWNAVFENWQSEFLQLIWQVAGLSVLLSWGSPQSKEGQERLEAKVDHLVRMSHLGEKHLDRLNREHKHFR